MIENKSRWIELLNSFESGLEVELYTSGHWTRQADFPGESYFYYFSVASLEDRLYVFGKLNILLIEVGFIFRKFMIFRYILLNINFQVATIQTDGHQFMLAKKQKEDSSGRPLQIFSKKDPAIAP